MSKTLGLGSRGSLGEHVARFLQPFLDGSLAVRRDGARGLALRLGPAAAPRGVESAKCVPGTCDTRLRQLPSSTDVHDAARRAPRANDNLMVCRRGEREQSLRLILGSASLAQARRARRAVVMRASGRQAGRHRQAGWLLHGWLHGCCMVAA